MDTLQLKLLPYRAQCLNEQRETTKFSLVKKSELEMKATVIVHSPAFAFGELSFPLPSECL